MAENFHKFVKGLKHTSVQSSHLIMHSFWLPSWQLYTYLSDKLTKGRYQSKKRDYVGKIPKLRGGV